VKSIKYYFYLHVKQVLHCKKNNYTCHFDEKSVLVKSIKYYFYLNVKQVLHCKKNNYTCHFDEKKKCFGEIDKVLFLP